MNEVLHAVLMLKGGYCLKSFAEGVALTLKCLLGDPCPDIGQLPAPLNSYVCCCFYILLLLLLLYVFGNTPWVVRKKRIVGAETETVM